MRKFIVFCLVFFMGNLYSQKLEFDCITIENNNNMLHVYSDSICEKIHKRIEIRRIPKKDEKKVTGIDMYMIQEKHNKLINFEWKILSGEYYIKIEIYYSDKEKYQIEKYVTF
ncbi:MAG: hypothetical protein KYX68_03380 [Flavobacterium sp.]|nr:hypothetical protein [Flavobacterium sp.]